MEKHNNWDKKQEELLEFDKIKEMWAEMALTEKAKEKIDKEDSNETKSKEVEQNEEKQKIFC